MHQWFRETLQEIINPQNDMLDYAHKVIETAPAYKDMVVSFLEKADIQVRDVQVVQEKENSGAGMLLRGMGTIPTRTVSQVPLREDDDILRHDALWFTQKRPDSSTELYSVSDFDSATLRKNASVSNAYRVGKLGAKPNPGSIFIPLSN